MEKSISKDKAIFITDFKVSSAETDMNGRLKIGSLINFLIQAATNSADNLGFGFENLVKQNLFWVFSRLTVEINRPIKWHEKLSVETWPKDITGILFIRDFIVRDINKDIVIKATTGWLAIDIETKRPARVVDSMETDVFIKLKNKHGIIESPEKIKSVDKGEVFEIESKYYDLDLNKHVTSSRYIDWMMDTLSLDFHKNFYPKKLSVNYIKETKALENISIRKDTISENSFLFEGTNQNNNKIAFRGRIDF